MTNIYLLRKINRWEVLSGVITKQSQQIFRDVEDTWLFIIMRTRGSKKWIEYAHQVVQSSFQPLSRYWWKYTIPDHGKTDHFIITISTLPRNTPSIPWRNHHSFSNPWISNWCISFFIQWGILSVFTDVFFYNVWRNTQLEGYLF